MAHYQIGISKEEALAFQQSFESYQEEIELFAEMPSIFEGLIARGKTVGIITNGTSERQSRKVEQLQLKRWIGRNQIVISEEVGLSKPDQGIFELLASQLSVAKEKTVYIGDNYINDVMRDRSAGWDTIWTNYREFPCPESTNQADYTVRSPRELKRLLMTVVAD